MEIIKATVEEIDKKHFISINDANGVIRIPISEDVPNDVKSAFNKLIARLKEGKFQIKIEEVGQDLFSQVANEYIMQLNREIDEIYGEMIEYDLIEEDKKGSAKPTVKKTA